MAVELELDILNTLAKSSSLMVLMKQPSASNAFLQMIR
jgi:hypothetical protein